MIRSPIVADSHIECITDKPDSARSKLPATIETAIQTLVRGSRAYRCEVSFSNTLRSVDQVYLPVR